MVPNDKLLETMQRKARIREAFDKADDVLRQGVQGISDLITIPGEVNLDFQDVRSVMGDAGPALMGIGLGSGENRAADAANQAISSPYLEIPISGARNLLINVTAGDDLGIGEVDEIVDLVRQAAGTDTNVFWGLAFNPSMENELRVTVVATGYDNTSLPNSMPFPTTASGAMNAMSQRNQGQKPGGGAEHGHRRAVVLAARTVKIILATVQFFRTRISYQERGNHKLELIASLCCFVPDN